MYTCECIFEFVCILLGMCILAKTAWKKRYFEEKKKTVSLEERCNQLRYEVEVIHKKILSSGDAKGTDTYVIDTV